MVIIIDKAPANTTCTKSTDPNSYAICGAPAALRIHAGNPDSFYALVCTDTEHFDSLLEAWEGRLSEI